MSHMQFDFDTHVSKWTFIIWYLRVQMDINHLILTCPNAHWLVELQTLGGSKVVWLLGDEIWLAVQLLEDWGLLVVQFFKGSIPVVVQFPDWFVAQIMGGSGLLIVPSRRGWSVLLLGGGFSFKDLLSVLKSCLIIHSLCFFCYLSIAEIWMLKIKY